MPDPDAFRAERDARWARSAAGWQRRADDMQQAVQAVTLRMVEAIAPRPGMRVLELAAGPGEPGLLVSELVAPGGTVLITDAVEGMVATAAARAEARGAGNVETRVLDLEWLDLPAASLDGILCRWGYMFAVDPEAALREARRVLRPGGRIALATWADPAANPFSTVPTDALVALGLAERPPAGAPGMFALADATALGALLEAAGFAEPAVDPVEVVFPHASLEDFVGWTSDLSRPFAEALARLDAGGRDAVAAELATRLEPYVRADGGYAVPGRALVASATA